MNGLVGGMHEERVCRLAAELHAVRADQRARACAASGSGRAAAAAAAAAAAVQREASATHLCVRRASLFVRVRRAPQLGAPGRASPLDPTQSSCRMPVLVIRSIFTARAQLECDRCTLSASECGLNQMRQQPQRRPSAAAHVCCRGATSSVDGRGVATSCPPAPSRCLTWSSALCAR